MRYLIVGAGIAGISAAKAIRTRDQEGDITVLSTEHLRPYYRPVIPYLITKPEAEIFFPENLEAEFGISFMYEEVTGADLTTKTLKLASGKTQRYDRLLIASGSRPAMPDIPGSRGPGVFTLRTAADAVAIREYCKGKKKAVVLGGGLVGIKAAIALKQKGLEVTVVEKADRILPLRIDRRGSQILASLIRGQGIQLSTGNSLLEILREDNEIKAVKLLSTELLGADLVVLAAGVNPNIEVWRKIGIKVRDGILVNELLRTNVPEVYAAGDVVEHVDMVTGRKSVSTLWTNAEQMGKIAGRNMSGGNQQFSGFLSLLNSTEIFGVPVVSAGLIDPGSSGYDVIVEDNIENYKKLVFEGDYLVGAVFIGDIDKAGLYIGLIKNRISVGRIKEEVVQGSLNYLSLIGTVPSGQMTA